MEDKKFALLIDSDNISSKYISVIIDEMTKYGTVTYKRIYGDWTTPQSAKWKTELIKNSITPIQQFRYTVGKNATDSTLIIDAMDILYTGNVDGFCIVSSDSDYWALIKSIPAARFLVMVEHDKCSVDMKNALASSGIFYCYTDDFYSGDTQKLKTTVILKEMYKYIADHMDLNARDMFEAAVSNARVDMPESEKNAFYDRYVRRLTAELEKDGTVRIRLGTL